ncbi:MAG: MBL fold metallo-hydrolase [Syntrophomonas sp.]|nr:MBL fold metallo-hydrolase [Syntrophomonas sp.]
MRLTKNVLCLGNQHFNHFIVGQEQAAIVECGVSGSIMSFRRQWAALPVKPHIKYLLASHAHFDHVCGIPALREMFPQAQLVGSSETKKVLANPKILKNFFSQDQKMTELLLRQGLIDEEIMAPLPEPIIVDTVVKGGDRLDLGSGLSLEVIDAPGHSPCNLAFYLPEDQVMFLSDTAGFQTSDQLIFPIFFLDFELYMSSIRKLMSYPTKVLAIPHERIWVNDEVPQFYQRALDTAQDAFASIKGMLDQGLDEDTIKSNLFARYYRENLRIYVPENISLCVDLLQRRVKQNLMAGSQ